MVDDLQDALEHDAVEEGRLDVLKKQLVDAKDEETIHTNSYEESVNAKDKCDASLRDIRNQMAELDAQIEEVEAKIFKADSKATSVDDKRHAALRDKNAALETINLVTKEQEEVERDRQGQIDIVKDFIAHANDSCPRVPIDEGETYDSLELKYLKLEKDLKNAEKRCCNSLP